ncbi:MAG: hypothetical protein HZB38_03290 [Planctomycetes bacterium]|nr:hypothetical protein [Planctomycetota bacterium]
MLKRRAPWILVQSAVAVAALVGTSAAQTEKQPAASKALAQFKAAGRDASLTVYPTSLIGRPVRPVGDVVALMLEKAGMKNLEVDAPEFKPAEKADLDAVTKAFGEFVKANPPKTDYALFNEFLGSHEKGFEEVRSIVVTKQGEPVWQDRQSPNDADFKKVAPKEPMDCCILVAQRLRPVLGLGDPTGASETEGKIAKRWSEKSGVPDKTEQAAIEQRQKAFKKAASGATMMIYPSRAEGAASKESAANLGKLLGAEKLTKASTADEGPKLELKRESNEQKTLWDMARGVREYVRAHRPETDYVLFADYLMGTDDKGVVHVGGVHFVVCDRDGQWVIVDFQNSHHDDFNSINPKSREDCDKLVARRLANYCR